MQKPLVAAAAALAALAVLVAPNEARAADHWGLLNGQTVEGNMVSAEAGWPDVTLGFTHGVSDIIDVGARFSILYGLEGAPSLPLNFGIGLRVPIRIQVLRTDSMAAMVHIDPGFKLYTAKGGGDALFGLQFPIGFDLGYAINPQISIGGGIEIGNTAIFTNGGAYLFVPELGPNFEYHIDEHLGFGAEARFGPAVFAQRNGNTEFAFTLQGAFMYRL
jgi:hypothetical protein